MDRIWLWVYYNQIPIYPIFYLLKGDYKGTIWPSHHSLMEDSEVSQIWLPLESLVDVGTIEQDYVVHGCFLRMSHKGALKPPTLAALPGRRAVTFAEAIAVRLMTNVLTFVFFTECTLEVY